MRQLRLFVLIILSLCLGCAGSSARQKSDLGLAKVEFHPLKPVEWKLANGLTVLFMEDHELPKVNGALYVRGGSINEPADAVGLSAATGSQMREGGVPGLTPDAFDDKLDRLGASIESNFGGEFGIVSFYCLHENLSEVFRNFSLVARQPQFNKERLELWKRLATEAIQRRRDNPDTMVDMSFLKLIYGGESPYGRVPTLQSIARISPETMKAFHGRFFHPDEAILVIAGDTTEAELKQLVNEQFGSWAQTNESIPPFPPVTQKPVPGIYVLERDFDQAVVMLGHLGPPRLTPDMYEMSIYNYLLGGGGFASELFQEVRTRRGLAYDVNGVLSPGPVAGTLTEYAGTRVQEVADTIRAMIEVTKHSTEVLPSAEEMRNAQSSVTRSFVFKFADAASTVNREAFRRMLKYPDDYDQNYVARINAVTAEQVREVGKNRVHPDDMVIVVVGKVSPADLAKQMGPRFSVYALSFDTEAHLAGQVQAAAAEPAK